MRQKESQRSGPVQKVAVPREHGGASLAWEMLVEAEQNGQRAPPAPLALRPRCRRGVAARRHQQVLRWKAREGDWLLTVATPLA